MDIENEDEGAAPEGGSLEDDLQAVLGDLLAEAGEDGADGDAGGRTYHRAEDGKFAKAPEAPATNGHDREPAPVRRKGPGSPLPDESQPPADAQQQPAQPQASAPASAAPVKYIPAESWGKLPSDVQQAIVAREQEVHRYASAVGRQLKAWGDLEGALSEKLGVSFEGKPANAAQNYFFNLAQAEAAILNDAESDAPNLATLEWLAQNYYGADLATLVAGRGEAAAPKNGAAPTFDPRRDPTIAAMAQRLQSIEQGQQQRVEQETSARRANLQNEFEALAKEKPLARDPAVIEIMRGLLASKQAATFAEAFEKASWIHPPAREAMLAEQRKTAAQRARSAAVSPRSAAPAPGAVRAGIRRSVEDDVRAAVEELI